MSVPPVRRAFRAEIVDFSGDPALLGEDACRHWSDGLLVVADGAVEQVGDAASLLAPLAPGTEIVDLRGKLILPGFVDTHVHYSQTDAIASYGSQLLEWLERYVFPTEQRFADPAHAAEVAAFFIDELLRNGTTTAMVFATIHPASVDAIFAAAAARRMRLIAGKVMMDRNCPEYLRDTAESAYEDSRALIDRWHGVDRLGYAVTPRFAPTSTERQLRLAGQLLDEVAGLHLQSHAAENLKEIGWVAELFPSCRSYIDVYERFGLLRERAVYAHCIHIDDADRRAMAQRGAAVSFCPTSNLFLGSGLFDYRAALQSGVAVGIGTDIGGGTSLSMLQTLGEAYKVLQMRGQTLTPRQAFHLATRGGAASLGLQERIGSFGAGMEADFVVVDPAATPLMERRMRAVHSLDEKLFVLMMLGDDRAIHATYLLGERSGPSRSVP